MSNLTERIEEYAPTEGPTDTLVDILRILSAHVVDLSKAVEILTDFDALRAERTRDLGYQIARLEDGQRDVFQRLDLIEAAL